MSVLPPGDHEIAWDEEGFGFVVHCRNGDDQEEEEVEKFLPLQVASTPEGRTLVVDPAADGCRFFLDSKSLEYIERSLSMRLGDTSQHHSLAAVVFERARCGFKVFVSLVSLYAMLGFNMFSGVGSRWAWQCLPVFQRRIAKVSD